MENSKSKPQDPYVSDHCAVLFSTDKVNVCDFKDHLKANLKKLKIENKEGTHIAILAAHGDRLGGTEIDYDVWDNYLMMEFQFYAHGLYAFYKEQCTCIYSDSIIYNTL